MAAAMDGLDVLVFTGGIGEHQPLIRSRAAPAFLGVILDEQRNLAAAADADIGAAGAAAAALVVTSREDIEIARQVRDLLVLSPGGRPPPDPPLARSRRHVVCLLACRVGVAGVGGDTASPRPASPARTTPRRASPGEFSG